MQMKQGELLKEYASSKGLSVAQLARDLEKDRSGIYALFRSQNFTEAVYNYITHVYPDFAHFKVKSEFKTSQTNYESQGAPSKLILPKSEYDMMLNAAISSTSLDLLCRLLAKVEDLPLDTVKEQANQLVKDKMKVQIEVAPESS